MKELINLGYLYMSDFIKDNEKPRSGKHELKLILDENINAPRLENPPPNSDMFGKYWYRSGVNETMKNELRDIVNSVLNIKKLDDGDIWVDIASNDGTLLSFLPKNLVKIGIDPADDTYKKEAEKHAEIIVQDYFSLDAYKKTKYGDKKSSVITCIAMFYDIDEPRKFLSDVLEIMENDGIFVLQMSYTPLMIKQLAFDNICHEHVWYYSLFNIKKLLEDSGFRVFNVDLNDVNGGSFRVYSTTQKNKTIIGSQQYLDVCDFKIKSILEYEKTLKLNDIETWGRFRDEIELLKNKLFSFLVSEKKLGKKIWGYGASTKGNTLLQYFGLNGELIDGIAERNPHKWGTKTVGTNIMIYSEEEMRAAKPDYLLILPWHFVSEFSEREVEFIDGGGSFIIPCPKLSLLTKYGKQII